VKGAKRVIAVDVLPYRLNMAREICNSEIINAEKENAVDRIIEMTEGHGADVGIDAVGLEAKAGIFEKAANVIHMQAGSKKIVDQVIHATRRGGRASILGVYGTNYDNFPLAQWMDKGLQMWAGQAPVHNYIDELIMMIEGGKIRTDDIITHKISLSEVSKGFDIFNKKEDNCVKVIMKP
jgi:S-(hydroxymethyl)glutathione dehydrogenase/alcohol dehydrogenase